MKSFKNLSSFIIEKNDEACDPGLISKKESAQWTPADINADWNIGLLRSEGKLLSTLSHGLTFGKIRIERKKPPRSLVNEILRKKIANERKGGRVVTRDQSAIIRNGIVKSLLPKTLPSYTDIQFFIFISEEVGKESFLAFDRANGVDVAECLSFLKNQKILEFPVKAFVPQKFYDNLVTNIGNGNFKYGQFYIDDVLEFSSKEKGTFEKKINKYSLKSDPLEMIDCVSMSNSLMRFKLKSDGLIKSIVFLSKSTQKDGEIKMLIDLMHNLLKG